MAQTAVVFKGVLPTDIVTTGYGAKMAGCDRRTFKAWAKKLGIEPIGIAQEGASPSKYDQEIYDRADADRVISAYIRAAKKRERK